jgi:hypothetical protein
MFFTTIFIALTASTVYAAPLHQKRIQQTISASTAKWEQACVRTFPCARSTLLTISAVGCWWRAEMQPIVCDGIHHPPGSGWAV